MKELETYLKSYFGISAENIPILQDLFESKVLKKDNFHTQIGQYNTALSFVKSGYLRVFSYTENKEITQWISSQDEFVTDLSNLMFQAPSRWNIQALTDCELITISASNYSKIADLIPEWDKLEKLFLAKCFLTLEDRVFSFISLSAEERYLHLFNNKKELFNQIPLQYLASMLGITPETLSRIRKKMIS